MRILRRWRWIGVTLAFGGLGLAVGGRVYHVAARPDWTESQAVIGLWWLWLAAVVMMLGGAIVATRE